MEFDFLAGVAGVIQGKRLAKVHLNHNFIHRSFNHSEARVLKLLHHALCDADESWASCVEDKACETCLKANAPRMGPSGSLPDDESLFFGDIWHGTVPEWKTGNRICFGLTHARSSFVKTIRMKHKSEAPDAFLICIAFFNSVGKPIKWVHFDRAKELMAANVTPICKEKGIRVTTTVKNRSRMNKQEPMWRVIASKWRTEIEQAKCPYNLVWGFAWDHAEEGLALLPHRTAPHDCALGRLLSNTDQQRIVKPPGSFRRPFGCLCYPTIAQRHPNGTLHAKHAAQSIRCLHFGYNGGRSGSFETLRDMERCQPGYICYDPISNSTIITDDVRFCPDIFPGLEQIPFADERQAEQPTPEPQKPPYAYVTDAGNIPGADEDLQEDFDFQPGFSPDESEPTAAEPTAAEPPDAPPTTPDAPNAPPAPPQPKVYLLPHARYSQYTCDEHDGKG
eukprot:3988932-Prymnesium_polylepis.1